MEESGQTDCSHFAGKSREAWRGHVGVKVTEAERDTVDPDSDVVRRPQLSLQKAQRLGDVAPPLSER